MSTHEEHDSNAKPSDFPPEVALTSVLESDHPEAIPRSSSVTLVDSAPRWTRNPADLFGAILTLILAVLMGLFAAYAQSTSIAVALDFQRVTGTIFDTIVALPINALEGLLSFVLPIILIGEMLFRRRWRTLLTAAIGGALAIAVANLVLIVIDKWWPQSTFADQLSNAIEQQSHIVLVPYVSLVSALLIVSVTSRASKITRWGWWLLILVSFFAVLQRNQTLPAATITILIGICCGLLARYAIGGSPARVMKTDLIALIRRAGIDATEVIRTDDLSDDAELQAWTVSSPAPLGYSTFSALSQLHKLMANDSNKSTPAIAPAALLEHEIFPQVGRLERADIDPMATYYDARKTYPATQSHLVSRNYLVRDVTGHVYHVKMLDNDRQILSFIDDLWARLTLKQTIRQTRHTLEATAEQMALSALRAEQIGISEPLFHSLAQMGPSILVAEKATRDPLLSTTDPATISDDALDALWQEIGRAHSAGISHGNMDASYIKVTPTGLHVTTWFNGSVISSATSRQVDLAQTVAMLAGCVGVERAIASMQRSLSDEMAASVAPFLQNTILPRSTREALKPQRQLATLRSALTTVIPDSSDVLNVDYKRFSIKTIITVTIGVVAIFILLGSLNFDDLRDTLQAANPLWMLAAFVAGLGTYVGAAMTLKYFTQEPLPLIQTTVVQVAASVVTLVAPAGIGPAALNLRFLQKRGVGTTPAVATVSVVQVAQFIVTVALLIILSLLTGDLGNLSLPSSTILITLAIVAVLVIVVAGIRPLRQWIMKKIQPTLQQVWPRFVWLFTHPGRLALGAAGSIFMSVCFIGCFGLSLQAFGYQLPLITLAITYLISNSVGSIVPSPGGIGPVEAALTGGLAIAGIPYSIAFSTAILYRLLTFWGRVPLGWIALQVAQKKNMI
ncbi:flippase-like domain-containing protein [Trueperella sp. LYQ143]|uniref:flippase-like domain-containing protein n=1 Tax=Trueperella sp. LYQ143 TaxID=3391059 RepID=UPI0039832A02